MKRLTIDQKVEASKKRTLRKVVAEIEVMSRISKSEELDSYAFDYQTYLYQVRNFLNAQGVTID
jgi:hypothetical protein